MTEKLQPNYINLKHKYKSNNLKIGRDYTVVVNSKIVCKKKNTNCKAIKLMKLRSSKQSII